LLTDPFSVSITFEGCYLGNASTKNRDRTTKTGKFGAMKSIIGAAAHLALSSGTFMPSEDSRLGVTSVFEGPVPTLNVFETRDQELSSLQRWIDGLLDRDVRPEEIAVLVRQDAWISTVSEILARDGVVVMPMHDAKGTEFRAVAVPCLNHDVLPDEKRILAARDEGQIDEVMSTERHLLYVAATRARDYLWMSGVAPVSEFLSDLIGAQQDEPESCRTRPRLCHPQSPDQVWGFPKVGVLAPLTGHYRSRRRDLKPNAGTMAS